MAIRNPPAPPANTCPNCSSAFDLTEFRGSCVHCGYVPGHGAD